MFESQSNTPESAQDFTIEDTLVSINHLANQADTASARITELEAKLKTAESELAIHRNRAGEHVYTISRARDLIQEVLAGDTDAESTFDAFRAPFELLGVSLTREVEIEITVTWRGTIELPHGTDPEDLDIDDFGITEPEHNYHNSYFNMGIHDSDISER